MILSATPDFYLASSEHRGEWARVRACQIVGKITDTEAREYLWINVDPPVMGQPYGLGEKTITDLLLLPHFDGTSLFPVSTFPLAVYIYRVVDGQLFHDSHVSPSNVNMEAWGELYATRVDAEQAARR